MKISKLAEKGGGGGGSSAARKSRWDPDKPAPRHRPSPADGPSSKVQPFSNSSPSPAAGPSSRPGGSPFPAAGPAVGQGAPPQPPYGFHDLERRTIVLVDGSVRSYFALPPDYELRHPLPPPPVGLRHDHWPFPPLDGPLLGPPPPEAGGPSAFKRKYEEEDVDELAWHRRHVLQYGSDPEGRNFAGRGPDHGSDWRQAKQLKLERDGQDGNSLPAVASDVDLKALKQAFLNFTKLLNENLIHRKNYLEDGRNGPLKCLACGRTSKDFVDVHAVVMHAYKYADLHVDHLGFHKALCVQMGWSYTKAPENSKAYQLLPAADAAANREDLIIWPPTVIIHNTNLGKKKDGRLDGIGNKEMDSKLKGLGFGGGKSRAVHGKEGHLGVTVVKFAETQDGLKEAERLEEFFEKDNHGRRGWAHISQLGDDDLNNPALFKVDENTGEKKRIFYGYLATAFELDKVDYDTRRRAVVKSRKEFDLSD